MHFSSKSCLPGILFMRSVATVLQPERRASILKSQEVQILVKYLSFIRTHSGLNLFFRKDWSGSPSFQIKMMNSENVAKLWEKNPKVAGDS